MSEYKVTFAKAERALGPDRENYDGTFIYIQPPVSLNSNAIERYLVDGDFQPVEGHDEIIDINVLGDTPEQTTIYASTSKEMGGYAQEAAEKVVEYLRFIGAQATLDLAPPDTNG